MNLFDNAASLKVEAKKRTSRNNKIPHACTIKPPHLGGLYRKGDSYELPLQSIPVKFSKFAQTARRKKVEQVEIVHKSKPLAGTFIITFCTALAFCIVADANAEIHEQNEGLSDEDKKPFYPFNTYVVEALITTEGFLSSEYAQGKVTGAKRIEAHLLAAADREGIDLTIDSEGNINADYQVFLDILECA